MVRLSSDDATRGTSTAKREKAVIKKSTKAPEIRGHENIMP